MVDRVGLLARTINGARVLFKKTIAVSGETIRMEENIDQSIYDYALAVEAKPRYALACIMNGTMSNGDYIRYSNLSSNTELLAPVDSIIEELTFANNRSSADFDIEFYKNQTTTPFTTKEIRNQKNGVITGFTEQFDQGDVLYMKYVDRGTNASDLNTLIWFRAT